jgi:hypothetical protein
MHWILFALAAVCFNMVCAAFLGPDSAVSVTVGAIWSVAFAVFVVGGAITWELRRARPTKVVAPPETKP